MMIRIMIELAAKTWEWSAALERKIFKIKGLIQKGWLPE